MVPSKKLKIEAASTTLLEMKRTPASADYLEEQKVEEPQLSKTGKAYLTFNNMGFDTTSVASNWVIEAFLKVCEENKGSEVLEIGSGLGAISKKAAELGVMVVSNDRDARHHIYARTQFSEIALRNIYFNTQSFPNILQVKGSKKAVMAHRVFHFLTGEEMEDGLNIIYDVLTDDGKLFIVTIANTHKAYAEKIKETYAENLKASVIWPGENFLSKDLLPEQAYALPEKIHVMDIDTLTKALERHSLKVEKSGFVDMSNFGTEKGRDGKEFIGIIASKKVSPSLSI